MKKYHTRTTCRICGSDELNEFLNLGETPLANSLLEKDHLKDDEGVFPLSVSYCKNCTLVQVPHVVDPEILFSDYYFLTSASSPLIAHFKEYSEEILNNFVESPEELVVDIGGNDGTLLNELKNECRVLNVEPAANIAEVSERKGINTVNAFFSKETVKEIIKKHGHAKVVTANNIIAHTDTVRELFEGVKELLTPDGVFIFETHWAQNLIGEGGFDQVYHEHLSYYSLHSLKHLVDSIGLSIFDVKTKPVQGESLRVYVSKKQKVKPSVHRFIDKEKVLGLDKYETYSNFSEKVSKTKDETLELLKKLKGEGKKIVGYGAPAKGSTLLNYYGIGNETLDYITDTTSLKQGRYMPGIHIPIYSPEKIKEEMPDYVLLLAWNFADAILEKEFELRKNGVKFIIPVPFVRIV